MQLFCAKGNRSVPPESEWLKLKTKFSVLIPLGSPSVGYQRSLTGRMGEEGE